MRKGVCSPRTVNNPSCVSCRARMQRAGREYFECPSCHRRARRLSPVFPVEGLIGASPRREGRRNPSLPSCLRCRHSMRSNGQGRFRCEGCHTSARSYVRKTDFIPQSEHPWCVKCRCEMGQVKHRWRCHVCHVYRARRPRGRAKFTDAKLPPIINAVVPHTLHGELREDVCTDLLIALLERRREGWTIGPEWLTPQRVQKFVTLARRRSHYQLREFSIDAGEFPWRERLEG